MNEKLPPTVVPTTAANRPRYFYCYARYKGAVRQTTVKFIYTEHTLLASFVEQARARGDLKTIDFPENDLLGAITSAELETAACEGRLVP